jgi:hypothetical protein
MNNVLLVGRDPNFAWALRKILGGLGLNVDHVYTLPEAELRKAHLGYKTFILDSLRSEEMEEFLLAKGAGEKVIIFDVPPPDTSFDGVVVLSKAEPVPSIIRSLKEHLL